MYPNRKFELLRGTTLAQGRMCCRLVVIASTDKQECEDPPSSFKSVREHFSVLVTIITTDKDKLIVQKPTLHNCCGFVAGCRLNMLTRLKQHYQSETPLTLGITPSWDKEKTSSGQSQLRAPLKLPLANNSDRVKAITSAIGFFIAADMRPFCCW